MILSILFWFSSGQIIAPPNHFLTLSWRRPLSYRNLSIDLLCKSMDRFLYDNGSVMKELIWQGVICASFSEMFRYLLNGWSPIFVFEFTDSKYLEQTAVFRFHYLLALMFIDLEYAASSLKSHLLLFKWEHFQYLK